MARKHKHPEHVNHERWLISYADFITLLFATFVALYALSKSDAAKAAVAAESMRIAFGSNDDKMIPQEAISEMAIPSSHPKPIPGDTNIPPPQKPRKEAGKQEFEEMKQEVEEYLITKGMLNKVSVDVQERGLVVSLKEAGFFESGKADVREESYQVVQEIANKISQFRNPVRIEGHTDNVPIHSRTFPTNWELSSTRATNMARLLVDKFGVPPGKISATGYGEHRPTSENDTPGGRSRNRRVDLVLLSSSAEKSEPEIISYP
jgi:chemotaxis protein MotB